MEFNKLVNCIINEEELSRQERINRIKKTPELTGSAEHFVIAAIDVKESPNIYFDDYPDQITSTIYMNFNLMKQRHMNAKEAVRAGLDWYGSPAWGGETALITTMSVIENPNKSMFIVELSEDSNQRETTTRYVVVFPKENFMLLRDFLKLAKLRPSEFDTYTSYEGNVNSHTSQSLNKKPIELFLNQTGNNPPVNIPVPQ